MSHDDFLEEYDDNYDPFEDFEEERARELDALLNAMENYFYLYDELKGATSQNIEKVLMNHIPKMVNELEETVE